MAAKSYDNVLMAGQRSNMDGIEATIQILKEYGVKNSPIIIALTAGSLPEDRKRCMDAGMYDYMTKAIRPTQLKTMLEQWQQKLNQV